MVKRILFQGDSITDWFRSREEDTRTGLGYPTLVISKFGYDHPGEYQFINRGISGDRIVDVYARIKCDIINLKPDYLSILLGVNDVWHEIGSCNGVEADRFERVYDMLLSDLKKALPELKIMLLCPFILEGEKTVNIPEVPDRWERLQSGVAERGEIVQRLAKKHDLPVVELQSRFDALLSVQGPEYWVHDGVHPTSAGHEVIARAWIDCFEKNFL